MWKIIILSLFLSSFSLSAGLAQTQPDTIADTKEERMRQALDAAFSKKDSISPFPPSLYDRLIETKGTEKPFEKQGIVALNVCLDSLGTVISTDFSLKGSNTTDPDLIKIAEEIVRKWRFSTSDQPMECDMIVIHFKEQ